MLWPGSIPFRAEGPDAHDEEGYWARDLHFPEHSGTHLDGAGALRPGRRGGGRHPGGAARPAAVRIDARALCGGDPAWTLAADDVRAWEDEHGAVPAGAAVLLCTGWHAYVDDAARYLGDPLDYPGYGKDAAALLVERGVAWIGIDTLGVDSGRNASPARPSTGRRCPPGSGHLEGLVGLAGVPPSGGDARRRRPAARRRLGHARPRARARALTGAAASVAREERRQVRGRDACGSVLRRSARGSRRSAPGRRDGRWPASGKTSKRLCGIAAWAALPWSTGMIESRSPQTIRLGMSRARPRRSYALTRWPRESITARTVCRKASRETAVVQGAEALRQEREVAAGGDPQPLQHAADPAARAEHAVGRDQRQHVVGAGQRRRAEQHVDLAPQSAARHEDEPVACARGTGRLKTIAMPPPSEWPTTVARSCPSRLRRSRTPLACAPSE